MTVKDIMGNTFIISKEEKWRIAEQAELDNILSLLTEHYKAKGYTKQELTQKAKNVLQKMQKSKVLTDVWSKATKKAPESQKDWLEAFSFMQHHITPL